MMIEKDKLEGALVGMILGDACLLKAGTNASLRIQHCARQKEYLDHKVKILSEITSVRVIPTDKKYPAFVANTRTHPLYTRMHGHFYSQGKKIIPLFMLKKLTDRGLALWYQDDGSLELHKSYNRSGAYRIDRRRVQLHTEGYTKEENHILCEFLNDRYGFSFRVLPKMNYFYLSGNVQTCKRFFDVVGSYVVPSMKYKTEMSYQLSNEKPPTALAAGDDIVRPLQQCEELDRNGQAAALAA